MLRKPPKLIFSPNSRLTVLPTKCVLASYTLVCELLAFFSECGNIHQGTSLSQSQLAQVELSELCFRPP